MSKKVAIIGGGFYGCAIASELSSKDYECTIYEKNNKILCGTASKNIYRIHKGPHYPRSKETALQCIEGYDKFVEKFNECVDTSYKNYFLISAENSKTNFSDYKKFCEDLKIDYKILKENELNDKFTNCEGGIICNEGVINIYRMREYYYRILSNQGCKIFTNCKIKNIKNLNTNPILITDSEEYEADIIINCSFINMNLISNDLKHKKIELIYQKTVCFKIKSSESPLGITIMDGNFSTILPTYWDENSSNLNSFFLYNVIHSVCRQKTSTYYPDFDNLSNEELNNRYLQCIKEFEKFVPNFHYEPSEKEFIIGDRVLRPNVSDTDNRISEIIKGGKNYYIIFQGKIDYTLNLANKMLNQLQNDGL